jgi:3-deoxy-manno-octulosonate cytidylyltransferase (CMP-KDO synthetase)
MDSEPSSFRSRILVAIPARWASTRFPGKPLALLGGVPVIVHVARAALQAPGIERPVLVATDDDRIAEVISKYFRPDEVLAAMTDAGLASGTDRVAQVIESRFGDSQVLEAAAARGERLCVVNVQGDEPFVDPRHIALLAHAMRDDADLKMATLGVALREEADIVNPNVVKIARAQDGRALYFSRAPIPFFRKPVQAARKYLRHLGVYAYDARWLLEMAALSPSPLEEAEKLEQLRALEHGVTIRVLEVESTIDIAIDTPEDLERAQKHLDTHSRAQS